MENLPENGLRQRLACAASGLRKIIFYPFRPHIIDGVEYEKGVIVIPDAERFGALQRDWSKTDSDVAVDETSGVQEDVL